MNGQAGYTLPQLAGDLRERLGNRAPGYRPLYNKVLDGQLRTVKIGGQHFVPGTLDEIAERLGLQLPQQAEQVAA